MLLVFYCKILQTINAACKALSSKAINLSNASKNWQVCLDELENYRHQSRGQKTPANRVAEKWISNPEHRKTCQRKRHFDEICNDEGFQDPVSLFEVNVFFRVWFVEDVFQYRCAEFRLYSLLFECGIRECFHIFLHQPLPLCKCLPELLYMGRQYLVFLELLVLLLRSINRSINGRLCSIVRHNISIIVCIYSVVLNPLLEPACSHDCAESSLLASLLHMILLYTFHRTCRRFISLYILKFSLFAFF